MRVLGSLLCVSTVLSVQHHRGREALETTLVTSAKWKRACGKKVHPRHHHHHHHGHHSLLQNPGAGMDPDSITPFESVLKDGYMLVACVKDSMYVHGDKFGQNKHEYRIGDTANSSIVHYTDHIAKEDREPMTHAVCFEFCRGIPDMGYFGISNGRDCYCETYYKPMASDSTECDSVCEGDNTLMCGGAKKNSIFGMHLCANTEDDLDKAKEEGIESYQHSMSILYTAKRAAQDGENLAVDFQEEFGQAGDPDMSNLMQGVKAWAGEIQHSADDGIDIGNELKSLMRSIDIMIGSNLDFTDYDNAKNAEDSIAEAAALTLKNKEFAHKFRDDYHDQCLVLRDPEDDYDYDYDYYYYDYYIAGEHGHASEQYYPLMYFVDKEFEEVPQTCSGDQAAKPIFGATVDECAERCDALPGKCVGFGYFSRRDDSICILWEKFKSLQYFTDCSSSNSPPSKFLQANVTVNEHRTDHIHCFGKLAKFEGLNLKPNDEGKCDICLKELTKANRCY